MSPQQHSVEHIFQQRCDYGSSADAPTCTVAADPCLLRGEADAGNTAITERLVWLRLTTGLIRCTIFQRSESERTWKKPTRKASKRPTKSRPSSTKKSETMALACGKIGTTTLASIQQDSNRTGLRAHELRSWSPKWCIASERPESGCRDQHAARAASRRRSGTAIHSTQPDKDR